MVANGSIFLINFIDWFRSRKLSPIDLILICFALSRLLLQATVILQVTLFILLNNSLSNSAYTLTGIWIFVNIVNLWFAACLSVFYLAKIAIFSHPLFLQVKRRFSGLVPWLLLGSVISSAVKTIILTTSWNYGIYTCNPLVSLSNNRSNAEMNISYECRNAIALLGFFYFIPLVVFLSSSILLISSLWKHMRRVRCNGTGTGDLNTQAHLSAIKALASFVVLYLISLAAFVLQIILVWGNKYTSTAPLFNKDVWLTVNWLGTSGFGQPRQNGGKWSDEIYVAGDSVPKRNYDFLFQVRLCTELRMVNVWHNVVI
ncbi:taste receptor type 2 member 7-like [Heteronotia binoei]|uniref:taste receptor type 2 member 7-like n=1 Tax=Heteronotia binoei TaxID=13085 RepID=UPI00292FACDD|nr:taste receptor type 2 member 7-like [Heteronotia binoei]